MELHNPLIKGTFILTVTGLLTRFMGFFYRIFLSHTFGEVQVGLYQLIFPIYALGYSATCAGIQTILSRCAASRLAQGKKKEALSLLYTSLLITVSASCCFTMILQKTAPVLAGSVLGDKRCEPLLILLSYVFPFSAIHSCITGYCLGQKDTKIPSSSQLLEQTVRIFSVLVICQFLNRTKGTPGIWIAVLGLIFGEISSALYSLKCVCNKPGFHFLIPPSFSLQQIFPDAKELLKLSLPLTGNRVLLNILQSIEAVSIPASLLIYGLSASDALSTYGVLTGMALPCILFPSALTNSVSTILLPAITEAQTQKNVQRIKKMIRSSLCGCIFLGTGCLTGFFLFGPTLGKLLFHSSLAGEFIRTLSWMCPFLYASSALISIIHGLGKTGISFLLNTLSLSIRIIGVLYLTAYWGITGYLHCLLASQIFLFVTGILYISHHLRQMLLVSHYNT